MKAEPGKATSVASPLARAQGRWAFRLAALALPLLILVLIELFLRLIGFGYPTSFFLRDTRSGGKILVENPKFGWRFFPPSMARAPLPLQIKTPKPPGTTRIVILGESAAMGDPEPAYGFGRQLQRILQARQHSSNTVEVVNVAMTAINSHVIREIANECDCLQGDFWIIYAGNNEVVGPFGAGTVFGPRALGTAWVRVLLAVKRFRVFQLVSNFRPQPQRQSAWQGMEFFLHNQVEASDPRLKKVYQNFSANLGAIIQAGQHSGASVMVCTVAANLKDCPPFGSMHRPGMNAAELKTWEDQFELGRAFEAKEDYTNAFRCFEVARQTDPTFAETVFQRAACELKLGQNDIARKDFSTARDLDALRFRIDSDLNRVIEEGAVNFQVPLIDARREFESATPKDIVGDEVFYDHVHFNFTGNYRMATLLARQIESKLGQPAPVPADFLSETEVAHQLAFTDFDRRRVGEEMRLRLQQPPFSTQSNSRARDKHWAQVLASVPGPGSDMTWEYRSALALFPGDWMMRQNFAALLENNGDNRNAAEQWAEVAELLPNEPDAYFHLGTLAYDAKSFDDAEQRFEQCLRLRPGSIETINGLGLVFAAQSRTNLAVQQFDAALKLDPGFSAARINLAVILANQGEVQQAVDQYQAVLRLDTNNVAARINLAKLWFSEAKTNEAIVLYKQAVEIRPDNPIAHFDLANALSAQGLFAESIDHYATAVQLRPGFADAQYNLGIELARAGRVSEAMPHLAEAARLNPASAEAHFNYGVALAKLQRYPEAIEQFQRTLKLEPSHESAKVLLNRALQFNNKSPLRP